MEITTSNQVTRLLNETELYQKLVQYLENTYVFRKLEVEEWLGLNQILFIRKNEQIAERLAHKNAEELWFDGDLEKWKTYLPTTLENLYEDFLWINIEFVGANRKQVVKKMIRTIIESELPQTLHFNPILREVIALGRQIVTGVKPLTFISHRRQAVELQEGEVCYLNWYSSSPYIANPAIVYKKTGSSYQLLFFTNMKTGLETSKLDINYARFLYVPADELGKTPEQAVLQRFC